LIIILKVMSKKMNFARKAKILENEKKSVLFGSQIPVVVFEN